MGKHNALLPLTQNDVDSRLELILRLLQSQSPEVSYRFLTREPRFRIPSKARAKISNKGRHTESRHVSTFSFRLQVALYLGAFIHQRCRQAMFH